MAIQPILYLYKGGKCASCGKTLRELVQRFGVAKGQFDFNHTDPNGRAADYSNLIRQKTLSSRQLDEVDKCVLLCKECHVALHGQNIWVDIDLRLVADAGFAVKHSLRCQVIRDHEKGDRLLHDAIPLLHLFRVKSGGKSYVTSCLRLKENGQFDRLLAATRNNEDLYIETLTGVCMYKAKKISEQEYEFSQSGEFLASAIHVQGLFRGGEEMNAFVRRGKMIIRSHIGRGLGGFRIRGTASYQSADPVETWEIETPDPEIPRGKTIDFGTTLVVLKAEIASSTR